MHSLVDYVVLLRRLWYDTDLAIFSRGSGVIQTSLCSSSGFGVVQTCLFKRLWCDTHFAVFSSRIWCNRIQEAKGMMDLDFFLRRLWCRFGCVLHSLWCDEDFRVLLKNLWFDKIFSLFFRILVLIQSWLCSRQAVMRYGINYVLKDSCCDTVLVMLRRL